MDTPLCYNQLSFIFPAFLESLKYLTCWVFNIHMKSLNILHVDTSLSFLLLRIPLDEIYSSHSLLDEVSPLDVESFEDRSTIETACLEEIIGLDSSLKEFVDELEKESYKFKFIPSSFIIWINSFNFLMISSFLDFSWKL